MNANRGPLLVGIAVAVVLAIVAASKSVFVVRVDQYAIVTEFGKPVKEIHDPGLYFMLPFVQDARYLDRRIRGWDDQQFDTKTKDGRQIDYVAYARWQIAEGQALTYYMAVGTDEKAHGAMDTIVTGRIQTKIRSSQLASVVRESGRIFQERDAVDLRSIFDVYRECNPEVNLEFRKTLATDTADLVKRTAKADGSEAAMRSVLVQEILEQANKELVPKYGIVLRDLHFKYLNYSEQVHGDIIAQIQADRLDDISSYLEVGENCVGYIQRLTDAERGEILGSGEERVREIDGEAQAKAIEIKSNAFGQAPDFYQFLKNLELFRASLDNKTRMVLSTNNPLLQLMTDRTIFDTKKRGTAPIIQPKVYIPVDQNVRPEPPAEPVIEEPAPDPTTKPVEVP